MIRTIDSVFPSNSSLTLGSPLPSAYSGTNGTTTGNTCKELIVYKGSAFSIIQSKVQEYNRKLNNAINALGALPLVIKPPSIYDIFYKTGFESIPSALKFSCGAPLSVLKEEFNKIPQCQPSNEDIYLTTNEANQEKTLTTLKREKLVGNTMIAVSSFFGLNAAAARGENHSQNLDYIIMIDRSRRVESLWKAIQEIVKKHEYREDALAAIKKVLAEKTDEFWKPCMCGDNCDSKLYTSNLENEVTSGISWLSSQERYAKIKRIFDRDHFIFKRLDLFDSSGIQALSKAIGKLNLTLDTVYLSNIREYAESCGLLSQFQTSVQELRSVMTNQTLLIDTQPRLDGLNGRETLTQRVSRKVVQANIQKSFPPSPTAPKSCNCPFCATQGPVPSSIGIPMDVLLALIGLGNMSGGTISISVLPRSS